MHITKKESMMVSYSRIMKVTSYIVYENTH